MKYLKFLLPTLLLLANCRKVEKLEPGTYDVSDQEYSGQSYIIERDLGAQGKFTEKHQVDYCLLMELSGEWIQSGGTLKLQYQRVRNRQACRDSLSQWANDSTELNIPLRNVTAKSYESLLAASDGKPEKWILWNRQ